MIKSTTHQSIHTLFGNDIFPEQIIRLTNINSKALRPEIVSELLEVLNERNIHDPELRYKEDCLWIPKKKFYK